MDVIIIIELGIQWTLC